MLSFSAGTYTLQGISLLELTDRYGAPLYIYDAQQMKDQYERLQRAFSAVRLKIKYACKALTNLTVLQLFHRWGAGLDTVSIQEVQMGLMAGFAPTEIIFTPNCISFAEMQAAMAQGVGLNIDNLPLLERFGQVYGASYPCCIRLNPHLVAGGNPHLQTGHKQAKFGISIDHLPLVVELVHRYSIRVIGLHTHSGSEIQEASVFLQQARILYEAAVFFPELQFLDLGSGFKVSYQEGESETNVEELGNTLGQSFNDFGQHYGRPLELWIEPGKFLVSQAGYLLVQTNVVKQTGSTVFVGVNSGQNHLLRPMFYQAYHQILNLSNPEGLPQVYTVVGYICETDTFGRERTLAQVREGDILCFGNAGAYGFSMSSNYNSRPRPAEILIYDGKDYLIRRRENLADLLRTQIPLVIFPPWRS